MEQPKAHEETVGDQGVLVGMEIEVLAEGVNRHDDTGQTPGGRVRVVHRYSCSLLVAADAGKALFEIVTVEELADDPGDDRPQVAVPGLVTLLVDLRERLEMFGKALTQRRCPGLARTMDLLHHAAQCIKIRLRSASLSPACLPRKLVRAGDEHGQGPDRRPSPCRDSGGSRRWDRCSHGRQASATNRGS